MEEYHGILYPTVKCGYCGKEMGIYDVDKRYSRHPVLYYSCECGSHCIIQNGKVLTYGKDED